jgi:ubiquinone/menaquinone biosynthesis C-methylase UbiE
MPTDANDPPITRRTATDPSSPYTDPQGLLTGQYRDGSNLNARAALHLRFGTATAGWFDWVMGQLAEVPAEARIVEIGCGPGLLWRHAGDRIPSGWQVDLTDFSRGMVTEARRHVAADNQFTTTVAAAGQLPFADERYDAAVANHMLYHVPDLDLALADLHRVLRPGGQLFAATNGERHLWELHELVRQVNPTSTDPFEGMTKTFQLENGPALLAPWFAELELHRYDDILLVTEVEPLVAYVASMAGWLDDEGLAALGQLAADKLARDGAIRLTKDTGMLVGQRPERRQ